MIKVAGSIGRSYIFPAPLAEAFAFYADLVSIFDYLPHINMVKQFNNHQFRMHYQTVELAAYHINVFSDIATQVDYDAHIIHITPLANYEPVQTSASMNATTAPGTFSMRSVFEAMGGQTRVEYQLEIHSNLPRPTGLRLMPRTVVNKITQNITQKRMREIAEGFIENSIEGFLAQEEASEEEFWDEAF